MKILFNIKIDESLGTIYEYPIMKVSGHFNEDDVEEFIETISKDMREMINKYIEKKKK